MKPNLLVLVVVGVLGLSGTVGAEAAPAAASGGPCGLAGAAFCDTFDKPTVNPAGDREGQLDGRVWGVSRDLGYNNIGQGQYAAGARRVQMAGSCPSKAVTIETDIAVCHGQLNDVVNDNPEITPANKNKQNDNGTVTSLAMYPKQPFDFSGRTGKIVFDVSDDSGGMHTAWPELWLSDSPAPDPFVHFSSWQALPKSGFGIRLGAVCVPYNPKVGGSGDGGCGPTCHNDHHTVVTVSGAITINNYKENDSDTGNAGKQNPATLKVVPAGCVVEPTKRGQLNHFEIDVSKNRISVFGTDAGRTSPLIRLATIVNAHLGSTRGLVWLEDVHYNGNKDIGGNQKLQGLHTFTWDNVGFDGPLLPRDLGFDAADSKTTPSGYPALLNLGWLSTSMARATITIPRVSDIEAASGGLLTFNYMDQTKTPVSLAYSLNGKTTHIVKLPHYPEAETQRTIGIPIKLSEVHLGTNHVRIWSGTDGLILSNVSLILQGAGGLVPAQSRN